MDTRFNDKTVKIYYGREAWIKLEEYRRKASRTIYEDEEVNSSECYIIILEIMDHGFYYLVKLDDDIKGYFSKKLDKRLIDRLLSEYRKCIE